ncbi:MAG TPA: PAS domain S-box protein [Acidimicrobiales bacterium]|nr:PAS domain S-box protein [Acidimicrobiales bacterium]
MPPSQGPDRLLEALVGAVPDGVVVVDAQGRIEMVNPAVETLFGYRQDELTGQPVEVLVPEEVRGAHLHHREAYVSSPRPRPMGAGLELQGRRRDGTTFPIDVSLAPVSIGGQPRFGAFVRDATERRRSASLQLYVNEIDRQLLSGVEPQETLFLIASRARTLVRAAVAWVVTADGRSGRLEVAAAEGTGADALVGVELPPEATLSARVMKSAEPLVVPDMAAEPAVLAEARTLELGPGMYVPLEAEGVSIGALVVARAAGQPEFSDADQAVVQLFAGSAAVTLSLALAREQLEDLRMATEHDRIARDLHDTVIQRLFALGMGLQGILRLVSGAAADRINQSVDAIDDVIREIRETIFDLQQPATATTLRRRVREVAAEARDQLGFPPRLAFRGPVESAVPDPVVPHLLAVVREALSNAARHAGAGSVEVVIEATSSHVSVWVADDGVGPPAGPTSGSGLVNRAARAEEMGGELRIEARQPRGTVLEWRVTIGPPPT